MTEEFIQKISRMIHDKTGVCQSVTEELAVDIVQAVVDEINLLILNK